MYPVMMKMGNIIGEKLSGAFEALAAGDVAGAFAILFEEVDFNQILTDAFAGIHAWLDETDWDQVWLDIQAGLVAFGTEIWDRILVPLFTAIAAELGKVDWWDAIWDTLKFVIPVLAVSDLVAGLASSRRAAVRGEWRSTGESSSAFQRSLRQTQSPVIRQHHEYLSQRARARE